MTLFFQYIKFINNNFNEINNNKYPIKNNKQRITVKLLFEYAQNVYRAKIFYSILIQFDFY